VRKDTANTPTHTHGIQFVFPEMQKSRVTNMATKRKFEDTTDKFASTAYVLYVITFSDIKENQNSNKHNQFCGKVIDLFV
jgi:hypothetical protein